MLKTENICSTCRTPIRESLPCLICNAEIFCQNPSQTINDLCINRRTYGYEFCKLHTCSVEGCVNNSWCLEHMCSLANTSTLCTSIRANNSQWCEYHTCALPHCNSQIRIIDPFKHNLHCDLHQCFIGACPHPVNDTKLCSEHQRTHNLIS